jgi:hypothetical protein
MMKWQRRGVADDFDGSGERPKALHAKQISVTPISGEFHTHIAFNDAFWMRRHGTITIFRSQGERWVYKRKRPANAGHWKIAATGVEPLILANGPTRHVLE